MGGLGWPFSAGSKLRGPSIDRLEAAQHYFNKEQKPNEIEGWMRGEAAGGAGAILGVLGVLGHRVSVARNSYLRTILNNLQKSC
jgi:hypothetical protein